MQTYFPVNWQHATEKFVHNAHNVGDLNWCVAQNHSYDIPYVIIGNGSEKFVFYSGISGLDAFYGSAAQNLFLDKIAPNLTPELKQRYTIVLIHAVNGWGMDNNTHETIDSDGNLVDLGRNFLPDFNHKPQNKLYNQVHKRVVKKPYVNKMTDIDIIRQRNLYFHEWDCIEQGQYHRKTGLFYGGNAPTVENKMLLSVFDRIAQNATGLFPIALVTGNELCYRYNYSRADGQFHSRYGNHYNQYRFFEQFYDTDTNPLHVNGNLLRILENRYNIPKNRVFGADFCVCTDEYANVNTAQMNKIYHMGNARYEYRYFKEVSPQTKSALKQIFCPSDAEWRQAAIETTYDMYKSMFGFLEFCSKRK